ncbi:MAG: 3'-5' exonuclease [Treponema sp.]|nr:3'-5' exonuclease [Treponema sp.]
MPRTKMLTDYKRLHRLVQSGAVFCAFDTETTGLFPKQDRIIELGAVKFNKTGVLDTFNTLVNPEIPLPPVCQQVSHITDDMVRDAPKIASVLLDFLRFSEGCILVAHNALFDIKFTDEELKRCGLLTLTNQAIDTLNLSRWAYPANGHWKLQILAAQFDIKVKAAHRACDDARVCMEVFLRCIRDTMDKQKPVLAEDSLF